MKILMTNAHLELPAGSENWVMTMAVELMKRSHEIIIFTFKKGQFAERIQKLGLKVVDYFDPEMNFDLGIINHNNCLKTVLKLRKHLYPLIFTLHGPTEKLEQPVPGADYYIAVSEEVQSKCRTSGFSTRIIRNPIDCQKFKSIHPINSKIKKILALSHHMDIVKQIRKLGGKQKVEVIFRGHKTGKISWNVNDDINLADMVITIGRGCLEAMACGRNVIVYGKSGADGFIDDVSIIESRMCNCSGRRYNKDLSRIKDFLQEILKYNVEQGLKNRKYILKNNEVSKIVDEYLSIIV